MQIQTLLSGNCYATDCLKLRGNISKMSLHTWPLLYSFPNYQLLLATVGNTTLSWTWAKHYPHLTLPSQSDARTCHDTTLSPCSGTRSSQQVLSLGHLQVWRGSADRGSSEDQAWGLREIQDSSITIDVEAEREKSYYFAFIFLSFLVSWSEYKMVWLFHLSCLIQKIGNLTKYSVDNLV